MARSPSKPTHDEQESSEQNNLPDPVFLVWKIPDHTDPVDGGFDEIGIYPAGELMAICPTKSDAKFIKSHLEEHSPSEQFGNSMAEAPYTFVISKRMQANPTTYQ